MCGVENPKLVRNVVVYHTRIFESKNIGCVIHHSITCTLNIVIINTKIEENIKQKLHVECYTKHYISVINNMYVAFEH